MPYLTTDAAADTSICRRFRIPVNMLANFMGALYVVTNDFQWEPFGDLTAEESAEAYREIIDSYSEGCMIGTIFSYLTDDPPAGSLALDGSTYDNDDYPALIAAGISQWDNGDGTFTLPDSSGRVVVGAGAGAGLTARSAGDTFGVESVTLTEAEIPAHSHGVNDPGSVTVLAGITAVALADPGLPSLTGDTGGGDAHENMQPSIVFPLAVWVS